MYKQQVNTILLIALFAAVSLLAGNTRAIAEENNEQTKRFITIDFENVDIRLFIKYISELTGKNFIVDKRVTGNVTIVSPTKISEKEAYKVFESVLNVHGYTTVDAGAVTKIVPAVSARSENIRTFRSSEAQAPEDTMVTQLIPLQHITPDEVKKVLAPLVSKTSVVIPHTQSGILIVTETLSNIQRLLKVIEAIDVAYTGEKIAVLPLEYGSAETVSRILGTLFQKGQPQQSQAAGRQTTIKIVPYERINALIVVAAPADIERVENLVDTLDSEMKRDSGNIHVIYLKNANAEDMAEVLNFLPGQQTGETTQGKAPTISKNVRVMADEETNSLLITASRSEFNVLQDVIEKLDIPRRMVYLEALILEVNTTKDFEVGVEWAFGGKFSDDTGTVVGGFTGANSSFDLLSNIEENAPPAAKGLAMGVIKQGIQIGGITFPNIGAVLNAYKNDSDINIVSTPQILTTDNTKAEISVGENVPYITSENTNAADQNYTNYEYRDVSTKLTITPQINQAETLRLEIATEVIKLKDNTNNTPTTFKRTADTTVIVKNNETVVIGGIIGQDSTNSTTKVPLLGDIPVLGWLFRADSQRKTQTNMFVFITPRIIKNPADLAGVTVNKEAQMGEVMPEVKRDLFREADASHALRLAEMGFDRMKRGQNSEAKNYFIEALDIDPDNPYALYNLGVLYEGEGNRRAAVEKYQRVILTGSSVTAVESTDPDIVGVPLIQLARERLEALQRVKTQERDLFEEENGK
jgi:general secretion pathway protein D